MMKTKRLNIRKFTENDLFAFFEIMSDEEVNTFLPWNPLRNIEEAKEMLDMYLQDNKGEHYAVCLNENDVPIGYVNVSGDESHDFGYGLRKAYWYQGIMSEACREVLIELKKTGIPYISATHDRNNQRSGEVMKRLGMRYEYSYEEFWRPKNILVTFRMYQLNFDEDAKVFMKYWNICRHPFIEEI